MSMRIFRWKAIAPLILVLLLLAAAWMIFADTFIRHSAEDQGTLTLGTEVDIATLTTHLSSSAVVLGGLEIADPFDSTKNLVEAGRIELQLEAVPLLEKKIVIDRMVLGGMRFGTRRRRVAHPVKGPSAARTILQETRDWAKQFDVPLLHLTPIETLKSLVLNPGQLQTVKAAEALTATADSARQAFETDLKDVHVEPIADSAAALGSRLKGATPQSLGLQGAREAIAAIQRTLDQIKQTRDQVNGLERSFGAGVGVLGQGLTALDDARLKDYAFARGLLKLPSFDAPDIGTALFGKASIDPFQQALYYAQLAEKYIPPGLQPWRQSGPRRLRMAGTTVRFPKEREYPTFLLRQGSLDFSIGHDSGGSSFAATVSGLTNQPALYGRPARLQAKGRIGGASPMSVQVAGVLDHLGKISRDSVQASVTGVPIPSFDLPGLPFGLTPGHGDVGFNFAMNGDRLNGRWSVHAAQATFTADSARIPQLSLIENTVWRVLSGIHSLDLSAGLSGTIREPRLSIQSNIDEEIAARLKAIAGEELAKGEARARAAVDKLVDEKVAPVKARVAQVQADITQRIAAEKARLDDAQRQLEAQLKTLAGPAGGLLNLPKIRLP
ncbi:MAG: TIGR03545 family protein [Gemmatimonadota bacterium]